MRLREAFEEADTCYVTVRASYREDVPECAFHRVKDATRWDKFGLMVMCLQLVWILLRRRPHVVVSTGAAPGYFALRLGRLLGARTIWVDSIANVEELSMGGQLVGRHADLWLTQWPALATDEGPQYFGSVLGEDQDEQGRDSHGDS
jgi:hypothetical protein